MSNETVVNGASTVLGTPSFAQFSIRDGGREYYAITWLGQGADGKLAIYNQLMNRSGGKIGGETIVSSNVDHDSDIVTYTLQSYYGGDTSYSVLRYTTVWTVKKQDGSGWEIHQQLYGTDGNKVGQELVVNTGGTVLSKPSVAQFQNNDANLANDTYVITWLGQGANGMLAVYQQRVSYNGAKVGGETLISTNVSDYYSADEIAAALTALQHDVTHPAPDIHEQSIATYVEDKESNIAAADSPHLADDTGDILSFDREDGSTNAERGDEVLLEDRTATAAGRSSDVHTELLIASGENELLENADTLDKDSESRDEQKGDETQGYVGLSTPSDGTETALDSETQIEVEAGTGPEQPTMDGNAEGLLEGEALDATDGQSDSLETALKTYGSQSDALALIDDTGAEGHSDDISNFNTATAEDLYNLSPLDSGWEVVVHPHQDADSNANGLAMDDFLDQDIVGTIDLGQFGKHSDGSEDIGVAVEKGPVSIGFDHDTSVSSSFLDADAIYDMPSIGAPTVWADEPDRVVA
jgi:hypothetical protein